MALELEYAIGSVDSHEDLVTPITLNGVMFSFEMFPVYVNENLKGWIEGHT